MALTREEYRARLEDRGRPQPDKIGVLEEACRGRRVLDLGCIDHSWRTAVELGDRWLHARLAAVADGIVGVDILADDARALSERGFDIRVGDVEDLDLGETFDVVVAGDLIEHLGRPLEFLHSIARHCHGGSRVYVSTPNPFNLEQVLHIVAGDGPRVNPQHVTWFDPEVLWQLVERSPLVVTDAWWVDTRFHFPLRGRVRRRLAGAVVALAQRRWPRLRRDLLVELAPAPGGEAAPRQTPAEPLEAPLGA